jgi:hypothetical protein
MNTKFTPEYVLNMLQEIKKSSDQDNFYLSDYYKKYPSFHGFKKILINKGIISKEPKKPKWISIIPNIIMAKEVSRIFIENRKKYLEDLKYKNFENDNQINNEIEITKNNTEPISYLQENINPIFFNQTQKENDFISFAKKIRKTGEKWNDAVSRASRILKSNNIEPINYNGRGHKMKATTDLAKEIRVNDEKWTDAIKRASGIINGTTKQKIKKPTIQEFRPLTLQEIYSVPNSKDFEILKKENKKLREELEFEIKINNKLDIDYEKYKKSIKELEFKLNIETTANGCFKQRIRELEKIPSSARELKSIHEKEIKKLTNQIEVANKDLETFQEEQIKIKEAIDDLSKINDFLENQNKKLLSEKLELDSKLKQQIQEHAKRFDELVKERNNYISEYSNYINEKLVEIADLKNKLLKENKIVCYKIFGITIFKVTTNKRN